MTERFRSYFEHAPIAMFIADERGRYVEVNPAACRMTGYTADELLKLGIADTLPPEAVASGLAHFERVRDHGTSDGEFPFVGKGGRTGWWSVSATKLSHNRFLGFATDITARKSAEAELIREKEIRQLILDSAPVIILLLNVNGRIEYINRFTEELSGYALEEIRGKDWFDTFLPERDRNRVQSLFHAATSGTPTRRNRNPIVTRTGEERLIEWCDDRILDSSENVVGLLVIGQDVTDQSRAEHDLLVKDQAISTSINGIAIADIKGRLTYVNRSFLNLLGYDTEEEVLGHSPAEFVTPPQHAVEVMELIIERGHWFGELTAIQKSGRLIEVQLSATLVLDPEGRPTHMMGSFIDISERFRAEAACKASERKFRTIFESEPECVKLVDRQGRLIDINPSGLAMVEADSIDEVRGRSITDVLLPQYREAYYDAVARVFEGERVLLEYEITGLKGTRRWVEQYAVQFDEGGDERGSMLAVTRDITRQKQFESALRESEEGFRALFEQAAVGIAVGDLTGTLLNANQHLCRMLGYSVEELLKLGVSGISHPDDMQADRELFTKLVAGEISSYQIQKRYIRKDGSVMRAQLTVSSRECGGKIEQAIAVVEDITERQMAEARLRESEELLRIFVENAPAGVAMLDRELRYIAHSRRWIIDYDLADSNLIGRSHYEVFPEIPERWKQIHKRCLQGLSDRCAQDEFIRIDGSAEYLQWEIQPWWDSSGEVGGLVFFTERITERVLFERRLRESQERLAEAQRIANVGSWNWNLSTGQIAWSDEVFRIFGYAPQSFVPRLEVEFFDAVHPDDRQAVMDAIGNALTSQHHYSVEHRIIRRDGVERVVREEGEVSRGADGKPDGMFGTVQDVTERRRAEEQAASLRDELSHVARVAAIGELAAGIAHELNQPLEAIANYAYAAQCLLDDRSDWKDHPASARFATLMTRLTEQALRGGEIIRRLHGWIRKQPADRVSVTIGSLIREVLGLLSGEIQQGEIELCVNVPEDLPQVVAEPIQIQQVLVNLCRNSIQAMRGQAGGRRLEITAFSNDPQFIAVQLRDWGPGIPESIRHKVFEPFVTSKPEGLGFGLAISRRIIESHGGELRLSDEIDTGVQFQFTLPVNSRKN